jgi:hydroxyacylglutathione hydrolase
METAPRMWPGLRQLVGLARRHDRPVVVVREPDQDLDEVLWQAAKIGYENIVGELAGGIDAWKAASLPTTSTALTGATVDSRIRVLDIRQEPSIRPGTSQPPCTSSSATSRTPSTGSLTCPRW